MVCLKSKELRKYTIYHDNVNTENTSLTSSNWLDFRIHSGKANTKHYSLVM